MSTLFTDQLDEKRQKVYQKFSAFADEFVLAGGTAIMLQISHRRSYDFDCFSQKPLKSNLLRKCEGVFGKKLHVGSNTTDLLWFRTEEEVQIDFVYYPYPPAYLLVKKGPIPLFHLSDLASNKAHTIGRRGMWRDYVDLFFFLKWKLYSLGRIISEANKRFEPEFNDKLFLEQLSYFDDINIVEIDFLQKKYSPDEIKSYLIDKVRKYTQKVLKSTI